MHHTDLRVQACFITTLWCLAAMAASPWSTATAQSTQTMQFVPTDDTTVDSRSPSSPSPGATSLSVRDGFNDEALGAIEPTRDTYVRGGRYSGESFGDSTSLVVKNVPNADYDRQSYLRFDLSEVTGYITHALLVLRCKRGTETGGGYPTLRVDRLYTPGEGFDEHGLTWDTQYTFGTRVAERQIPNTDFEPQAFDDGRLTLRVQQQHADDGIIAFRLHLAEGPRAVVCRSREHSDGPLLVYNVDWSKHPDGTYNPDAPEAYRDTRVAHLRFDASTLTPYNRQVDSATLTFTARNVRALEPNGALEIWTTQNLNGGPPGDWNEQTGTWANMWEWNFGGPPPWPTALRLAPVEGAFSAAVPPVEIIGTDVSSYQVDVTQTVRDRLADGGIISLAFVNAPGSSNQLIEILSKESGYSPQLQIKWTPCDRGAQLGGGTLPTCTGGNLVNPTRIVVYIHGSGREANLGVERVLDAEALHYGAANPKQTLAVAPQFLDETQWRLNDDILFWDGSWHIGEASKNFDQLSSFEILDDLIRNLANAYVGAGLRNIVVVGHSSGGQMVSRYAVFTNLVGTLGNVKLTFAASAPRAYMFSTDNRPGPVKDCPNYNSYKHGLAGRSDHPYGPLATMSDEQARTNALERPLYFVVGDQDTTTKGFSCADKAQGSNRVERLSGYLLDLIAMCIARLEDPDDDAGVGACWLNWYRGQAAPGCPHSGGCNFRDSAWGRQLLFETGQ